MAFVSEMFDQLRDLLNDPTDSQISFTTKKMYLNLGVTHLWPAIPRIVTASAIPVVALTYEYALTDIVSENHILLIEIETGYQTGAFRKLVSYDLLPGDEDNVSTLRLNISLPPVGSLIRVRHCKPISSIAAASYAAAQSEVFLGPDRAIGLPVLYAMGMIAVRRVEDYLDAARQRPSNEGGNMDTGALLQASQFWMSEYAAQTTNLSKPLPTVED